MDGGFVHGSVFSDQQKGNLGAVDKLRDKRTTP